MKQKFLILLAMTLLPMSMLAQYEDEFSRPRLIGDFYYVLDSVSLTAAVDGCRSNEVIREIVIPNTVDAPDNEDALPEIEPEIRTYRVTKINDEVFMGNDDITSVTLGDNVEVIGEWAFRGCDGITSVTLGSRVWSIGEQAFAYCTNLATVNVNNVLRTIGTQAFIGCSALTAFNFPQTVTTIGSSAFSNCKSLTTIRIPNNVTTLATGVFSDCTSLSSVTFPSNLTTIGSQAFARCSALTNSAIPESVTTIGSSAFQGCTGFTTLTIPNNVVTIGGRAYMSCSGLTTINIGTSVTTIGENAFSGCKSLTAISIPDNVTTIGQYSFSYCDNLATVTIGTGVTDIKIGEGLDSDEQSPFIACPKLASITVAEGNTTYDSRENCNAIIETATNKLIVGSGSTFIPESVTAIADNAFYSISGLTKIIIPLSVQTVGQRAFEKTGLTLVNIDSKSTVIPDNAFTEVGSTASPCTLYAPVCYDFGTDTSGDYFNWKGGCFSLDGVTIALDGITMGTFYSNNPVDFSGIEDLKPYILVGVNTAEQYATIVPVKDAPAYTGLLLIGKPGVYPVPYGPSPSRYVNMLKGTLEGYEPIPEHTDLVFDSETMKFRRPHTGDKVEAGKAWLPVDGFNGNSLSIKAVAEDSLEGDLNKDGEVNITDVTILVNKILKGN